MDTPITLVDGTASIDLNDPLGTSRTSHLHRHMRACIVTSASHSISLLEKSIDGSITTRNRCHSSLASTTNTTQYEKMQTGLSCPHRNDNYAYRVSTPPRIVVPLPSLVNDAYIIDGSMTSRDRCH